MTQEESQIQAFDDFLWTATRYSDVLKIDRRVVAQGLSEAPSKTVKGRQVWHIRDGMPAIYRRVLGVPSSDVPTHPKDRLDHYRAERERLKLEQETGSLIPAAEVESVTAEAMKTLAQTLDTLPDVLERDAGISGETVQIVQRVIDAARESMYAEMMRLADGNDSVSGSDP